MDIVINYFSFGSSFSAIKRTRVTTAIFSQSTSSTERTDLSG